ncbi:MAG: hypothetical protein HND48_08110 [Chloroflexi bacterium]|nr:hypothetical protein [Chloroflexota bacterium]
MSRPVGWAWLAIVALLLAAAVVRIHDIGAQDIWADEGFTYFATQTSDLVGLLRSDVHPPLYFGALRLWADVAGTSELALRLPSALAGLLTVALVFRLALDLSVMQAPRQAAVFAGLAALMMVLSDLEVDLSQEARMYTVQSALSVAAVIAYVRWLKRGPARHARRARCVQRGAGLRQLPRRMDTGHNRSARCSDDASASRDPTGGRADRCRRRRGPVAACGRCPAGR